MSQSIPYSASEAYQIATDNGETWPQASSSFFCPHPNCQTVAVHYWRWVYETNSKGSVLNYKGPDLVFGLCQHCSNEIIFLDHKLIYPEVSEAPLPTSDMPVEILPDIEEARAIINRSPRGAAALLRLAVQKLLPILGASQKDINAGIAELVAQGKINANVQQALDIVRVIGNEAVHPGVMDLKDDTATAIGLIKVLNFIVEKAITEPKEMKALFDSLPEHKRKAIATRDGTSS